MRVPRVPPRSPPPPHQVIIIFFPLLFALICCAGCLGSSLVLNHLKFVIAGDDASTADSRATTTRRLSSPAHFS